MYKYWAKCIEMINMKTINELKTKNVALEVDFMLQETFEII